MPKLSHEALVQLVRQAPALIPNMLWPDERTPSPIHARELDDQRGILYPDFVVALLGKAARIALEKLMLPKNWKPQSDMFLKVWEEGQADGEVRGKATTLLKLLRLRGFTLSEDQRQRVLDCRDDATLEIWTDRVLTATSLDELFAGTL